MVNNEVQSQQNWVILNDFSDLDLQSYSIKVHTYIEALTKKIESISQNGTPKEKFIWTFQAKEVALLLRDTVLEWLKAKTLLNNGDKSQEEYDIFFTQLKSTVQEATSSLNHELKNTSQKREEEKKWKHHIDPSPVILKQLNEIANQVKRISRSEKKLDDLESDLKIYSKKVSDSLRQRTKSVAQAEQSINNVISDFEKEDNTLSVNSLSTLADSILKGRNDIENILTDKTNIDLQPLDIERISLPISTNVGELIIKNVDVESEIINWSSLRLFPELNRSDALLKNELEVHSQALMQLYNVIKLRLESASPDTQFNKIDYYNTLLNIKNKISKELTAGLSQRLEEYDIQVSNYFKTSQLFNQDSLFLPSAFKGSAVGPVETRQFEILNYLKLIKDKGLGLFNNIFSRYIEEEQLSVVSYIDLLLSYDPENESNALFMRKGFLGNSFTEERTSLNNQLKEHFRLWNASFGGAVLIHGKYGSGKSSFLKQIHHFVDMECIELVIGKSLIISDNESPLANLASGLETVVNYFEKQKAVICIDNLSTFADNPVELFEAYNYLEEFIHNYSEQFYVVVSMNNYVMNRLESFLELSQTFSLTMSMDNMKRSDIEKALYTRAMAVNDLRGRNVDKEELKDRIRRIAKRSGGNIGKALSLICISDTTFSENHGNQKFVNEIRKYGDVLKVFLLVKKADLFKSFSHLGDSTFEKIKEDVEYLSRIKILTKTKSEYSVNPLLRTFIESILL